MTINKYQSKSCCGSTTQIIETDKPIRKSQIGFFKDAGYLVPESFSNAGIFYAQLGSLVAQGSFGAVRMTLRCAGKNCNEAIANFESLLEKAIHS